MGWVILAVIVLFVVAAAVTGVKNANAVNEQLGVEAMNVHRVVPVNYLGGHPACPAPVKICAIVVTERELAIEKSGTLRARFDLDLVQEMRIETEQEATRRLTATRMLTVGVFALAFPKKTPGSVLITVETDQGPLVFEQERTTKAKTLARAAPALAKVNAALAGRPPDPEPAAAGAGSLGVADELAKLAQLRDDGVLSEQEFADRKRRLLDS